MAITSTQRTQLLQLLVTMFDAAPGYDVLDDLANGMANGNTIEQYAASLVNNSAFTGIYSRALTANEFATKFIGNLLGSNVTAATTTEAIAYVEAQLNAGVSRDKVILNVINALSAVSTTDATWGTAVTALNNKVAVADYFGTKATFTGLTLAQMQAVLSGVTSDTATVTTKKAAIDAGNIDGVGASGSTFTLTTGADNISGTGGNDTINAYIDAAAATDTFTGADTINGGAGTDTLVITTDGNAAGALPGATVTNVEVFSIREVGGTAGVYDFGTIVGETSVINNKSTDDVTFSNLASGTTVTVKGDGSTVNGATTFTMASATNNVTLNVADGVTAGNVTVNSTGAKTVTVNSTGATNVIGTLDVDTATATTALTINATTALTATLAADYAANTVITLAGSAANTTAANGSASQAVNLSGAALSANIKTVDASGLTAGGAGVTLGANTTSFVGGQGNDRVAINALVFNGSTTVAAGAGTMDVVVLTVAAALTDATKSNITGFEVLELADYDGALDAFDMSKLTGLTHLVLNADSVADGYAVTNISAAQAANIQIKGSQVGAPTLSVSGATTVGQLDTVTVTISDDLTAKNTITLADLTVAGVETLNFVMTDNLTVTAATGLTAMTSATFTGAGNLSFTSGALALNVNTVIDASASTGTVVIDLSAATTNGAAIKGSATKANTITGTNQNDVITGGTGVDIVKNQANAATDSDTVDFVSDSSADIFEITTLTGKTTITNFDAQTKAAGSTAGTAEDLVNVSNDSVDGGEIVVTAAGAQAALTTDRTYVIEQAIGTAGALTTGSNTTLTTADFTATTLTNVAAYLSERYTGDNDTVADENALFVVNNGTNTYIYAYADSTTANTTIDAAELTLIGVLNGALLSNEDVYQS